MGVLCPISRWLPPCHLGAPPAHSQQTYSANLNVYNAAGQLALTYTRTYLHPDQLGSATAGTSQSGAVLWREQYAPYGDKLTAPAANDDLGSFTGHIDDDATTDMNLTYMQARYYDPGAGRFTSVDPVGFLDTSDPFQVNRYAYSNNDPVNSWDPNGLDTLVISGDLDAAYGVGGGVSVGRYVQFDKHFPTMASTIEAISTNIGNPVGAVVDALTTVTETGTMLSFKAATGGDASAGLELTYSAGDAAAFQGTSLSIEGSGAVLGFGTNNTGTSSNPSSLEPVDPVPHSGTLEISASTLPFAATIGVETTSVIPDEKYREVE